MKHILTIIAGIILIFTGLWGGAWLMTKFEELIEFNFAAYVSACVCCGAGTALTIIGFKNYPSNKR